MNNAYDKHINTWLNSLTQESPPDDAFDHIMDKIHHKKRSKGVRLPAIAVAIIVCLTLWNITKTDNKQLENLQLLTNKITMIEQLVRNEVVNHSEPGSQVMEKMISMENWLDQLNQNIAQTDDTDQKIELLHAKLELLDALAALHIQYKPQASTQII